jgi:hypothetical protein
MVIELSFQGLFRFIAHIFSEISDSSYTQERAACGNRNYELKL